MLNKTVMYNLLGENAKGSDWSASAEYATGDEARRVYFEIVAHGYEASCFGKTVTAYLTDDMINEDDEATDAIVAGIERHLPDVCEGLTGDECWDEAFHLAHDWLIDNRRYEPEKNEELAVATADRLFSR